MDAASFEGGMRVLVPSSASRPFAPRYRNSFANRANRQCRRCGRLDIDENSHVPPGWKFQTAFRSDPADTVPGTGFLATEAPIGYAPNGQSFWPEGRIIQGNDSIRLRAVALPAVNTDEERHTPDLLSFRGDVPRQAITD